MVDANIAYARAHMPRCGRGGQAGTRGAAMYAAASNEMAQKMAPARRAVTLLLLIKGIIKRKMRRQKEEAGGSDPQRSKRRACDAGAKKE